ADAGPPAGARIAVGHVGGGFLAMHVQALDGGAALHHGESFAQHRGYMENVGDAIALEHVGEAFGAGHSTIVAKHGMPHIVESIYPCISWISSRLHGLRTP